MANFELTQKSQFALGKNIKDFRLIIKTLFKEVNNLNITIKELVLIKIINLFRPIFETYVMVLNKKTRIEKTFSNLDAFLKSFKKEKI